MNSSYRWIDCPSWELDFFGLPHRIPWPTDTDEEIAKREPFEVEHLVRAIDLMGDEATSPWTNFKAAALYFEELTEALEDSEIRRAREILDLIEGAHPGTSFRLFHQAYIARNEGQLEQAIAFYQQAAEKTPEIAELWNNLGMTLALTNQREQAVAAFRKTLAFAPTNRHALEGLAQLRELIKLMRDPEDQQSAVYVEIPQFREMASNQIEALAADPDQLLNYGEELFRAGIIPEVGVAALEKANAVRADHPRTLLTLARVYHTTGKLDAAHKAVVRLTELFPHQAEPFFHLAQMCNALGDTAGERAALEKTLELDPNLQAALGIWFELKPGEHDPAKEQQLTEFGEKRNSWMAFVLASVLCRERGDHVRALRWAERAVELAPESEEALLHLSSIIGDARDIAKLASAIKPKVESGKFSKRLDWNYAQVLRQVGLTGDAIAVLRKVAAGEIPEDLKAACATSIEAWSGVLTGTNVPLEVHPSGILLRDVLLALEDEDGGVILNAGEKLPGQGVFPWRAKGPETSVFLQQGQKGTSREPQSLGEFKIRGIETEPGQPATIECHVAALPDGAMHFRAAQNGKRLAVGWAPPKNRVQ